MQSLLGFASIAKPASHRYGLRAPRGGCTVAGKFYRGGCFCLPFDPSNPHGLKVEAPSVEAPSVEATPAVDPGDSWDTWDDSADILWELGREADPIETPAPSKAAMSDEEFKAWKRKEAGRLAVEPTPIKLAIYGFVYSVVPIPAGECGTVAFRMHRIDTNHTYDVIRNHFGEVTCDCPDYEYRRVNTGSMCKHGARLVELGMIPAPIRKAAPPVTPPARAPRPFRFQPSPDEMAEAAQLFGEQATGRSAYRRELAAAL